jgi:hypothetical protein
MTEERKDLLAVALEMPLDDQHRIAAGLAAALGYRLEPLAADNLPAVAEKAGVTSKMVNDAIALWNAMAEATLKGNPAHVLPMVRKLNPANRKALALRLAEFGPAGWRTCVEAVYKSAHCRGINDRGWRADISYLLQAKGSNKTVNGGWPADYVEKSNGGQRVGPSGRGERRQDRLRSLDAAVRGRLGQVDGREGGG